MIKLTFKVNGLKTLGDLPPQGRAAVSNAAAGRVRSVVEEHFDSLPSRQFWKEAADDVVVASQWTTREGKGETAFVGSMTGPLVRWQMHATFNSMDGVDLNRRLRAMWAGTRRLILM